MASRDPQHPLLTGQSLQQAQDLLGRPELKISRAVEWWDLSLSIEQERRYDIVDATTGQAVGLIQEESDWITRQELREWRHFQAKVLDCQNNLLFEVEKPSFLISSRMRVHRGAEEIGEVRGRWHPWSRNYDLYTRGKKFAEVRNPGLWWWTFVLKDEEGGQLAVVDRIWRDLGYERYA